MALTRRELLRAPADGPVMAAPALIAAAMREYHS